MIQLILTMILVGAFFAMRVQLSAGIRPDFLANTAIIGGVLLIATGLVSSIEGFSEGNMLSFIFNMVLSIIAITMIILSVRLYHRPLEAA